LSVSINTQDLESAAEQLLASCLQDPGNLDSRALYALLSAVTSNSREIASAATRLLIGKVVENLCDRFEPSLVDCYVRIFTQAVAACQPLWSASFLQKRYQQIRFGSLSFSTLDVREVFVLSRITLGADIAITSVFLDAAAKRWPAARIWLVGPEKNHELFSGKVRHWPFAYPRQSPLTERISLATELGDLAEEPGALLIDPDSRISQLGLVPIAPASRTFFFESRTADAESSRSLSSIASSHCFLRMGVPDAVPFLALPEALLRTAEATRQQYASAPITVSFGVGGNLSKRLDTEFEAATLRALAETGRPLWIDAGAGGTEADWVQAAVHAAALPEGQVHILRGSFAEFCAHISQSAMYVGYDSAGQHAAAALGIPSVTFFRGYVNERMLQRWTPRNEHAQVVPLNEIETPAETLQALRQALTRLNG
jgi:ADP-heptose:LPS heptosyltransferase